MVSEAQAVGAFWMAVEILVQNTQPIGKNVLPLTTGQGQSGYYDFQADLSSVPLTDYSDKIVINHMTAKPGN